MIYSLIPSCLLASFAEVAFPLHDPTRKDVKFRWSEECQEAFDQSKKKVTELAYLNFETEFQLEIDACVKGLGVVLSQRQESGLMYLIALILASNLAKNGQLGWVGACNTYHKT